MILPLAKLALRNTLKRGKKSWVTVTGVFIGIAAVVALVSLGQGLEAGITQEFERLGANNVFVSGDLTDEDVDLIKQSRGVDRATPRYSASKLVELNGQSEFVNVYGIRLDDIDLVFSSQGWNIKEGRKLKSTDKTSALIGPEFGTSYEGEPELYDQIKLDGNSFGLEGQISAGDPQAQNSVIVSLQRMRDIYNLDNDVSTVIVRVQNGFTQKEVERNIKEDLRRDREVEKGEGDFSTSTPQDILESLTNILGVIQGIVVGLASIALLVGGIGIMNTMYMAINERTQEIGVMKAIGASKREIRILFLIESGIIGLIGGIIGVLIGVGISEIAVFAVSEFSSLTIARGYNLPLIVGATTFATLLGIISGYLPSRKASKLDPAEALRYE